MNQHTSLFDFKSLPASLRAALVGALGGLIAFWLGEMVDDPGGLQDGLLDILVSTAKWAALCGVGMGPLILAYDNAQSLRGRWYRDLVPSLFWFGILGCLGGIAGELAYVEIQDSFTRGLGWSFVGASIGLGIGLVRRDWKQALRGGLGGVLGGFIGGSIFNSLLTISDASSGALSRGAGLVITGAMIGCLIRVAQDALRGAWLMGLTTGYEGKEYPLNKARVTVGRADDNDISLYRGSEIAMQSGAFVFTQRQWRWQGDSIPINGVPQAQAALQPGDVIQLGAARFLFQMRGAPAVGSQSVGAPGGVMPSATAPHSMPQGFAPQGSLSRNGADLQPWNGPHADTPAPALTWLLAGSQGAIILPPAPAVLGVGRGEMNEIILSDIAVSTHHARLEVAAGTLHVTDLGSTNGTYINGQRLSPQSAARLNPNDQLRLGQLEYVIQVSHHG